ncbi:MAG: translation elongation factor Ts [Anaerolineales bacterium]|nr:translation elongation factor Ts [Anaerolineales bacterium]
MTISTAQIKELREKTGAGVLDCREALEKSGGDLEGAMKILREKGLAAAAKRAGRETHSGLLDLYSHGEGRVGVMVEVNCETDFVARTEEFRTFAHEISLQIAANNPQYLTKEDVPEDVIAEKSEDARNQAIHEGKPENVIDRIVDGRLQKFYEDQCLLLQPYVRDDSLTVEELLTETIAKIGENITIRRFVRWEMGEVEE